MTEQTVTIDGIDLCYEAFGDPADPTVLLIAGGAQSMIWWEEEFCTRLAAAGRHVVRYDHRDTGRSTSSPPGDPSYTGHDLTTDPLRILDTLGVGRAHVVGLSLGGGIAQRIALQHPERLRTLCLASSSPGVAAEHARDSPGPPPQVVATFTNPEPEPDWTDRATWWRIGSTPNGRTREP